MKDLFKDNDIYQIIYIFCKYVFFLETKKLIFRHFSAILRVTNIRKKKKKVLKIIEYYLTASNTKKAKE